MNVQLSSWYVYKHSIGGKAFYVGCGTTDRILQVINRNSRWSEVVSKANGNYEAEYVSFHKNRREAEIAERKIIAILRPTANVMFNPERERVYRDKSGDPRTERIVILASPKEKQIIESAAALQRRPVSSYVLITALQSAEEQLAVNASRTMKKGVKR